MDGRSPGSGRSRPTAFGRFLSVIICGTGDQTGRNSPEKSNGAHEIFELHARCGSGGRIHLQLDHADRTAVIGYIGNPALYGKVVQEGGDFCAAQIAWMPLAVKEDELANPVSIAVLGPNTEVATTTNDGDLLKQARGLLTP